MSTDTADLTLTEVRDVFAARDALKIGEDLLVEFFIHDISGFAGLDQKMRRIDC